MKVSLNKEKGDKLEFTVTKIDTGFANMIRRFVMSQVPVFAIDTVTFYENSSTLFDEYLAHRIGLVPLKMGSGLLEDEEVMFSLDAQGPCTVYSGDLRSTTEKLQPASDKFIILKLNENENLRIEAKAVSGTGRKHAKWQASVIGYEKIKDNEFKFKMQGFMQLAPKENIIKATDILLAKLKELKKDIKDMKKEVDE